LELEFYGISSKATLVTSEMAKFKDMQGFTKNLKPENPLITGNCAVEICDLGLSRNSVVAKLKVDMLLGFPSR
jgi:hypothetical protein